MSKVIGDLTIKELTQLCNKYCNKYNSCKECPFYREPFSGENIYNTCIFDWCNSPTVDLDMIIEDRDLV